MNHRGHHANETGSAETGPRTSGARALAAWLVLPLVSLAVQLALWPLVGPHVWFLLFYPAVFASSWLAGPRAGVAATLVSCLLVWWAFVPPAFELVRDPRLLVPFGVFATMGALFAVVHEQLRRANRRATDALATAESARQEIAQLYERTRQLDELKTQFFSNVSHELRTPLTLILGPAQRMLAAPETPAVERREAEVIARNARTLLHHVDDLLEATRLEAGRVELAYAALDVGRLARLVASHFELLAEEKDLAFTIDAPDEVRAEVDPDRLRRVVLNLLSNAFKFTPSGGRVRLTVRAAEGRVIVEVADSGPGIPVDRRAEVFGRFSQLERHAARRFGGTGLGLAIARDLVALHAGTIAIAEAPEGGALFRVELPATAPAGHVVAPEAPAVLDGADARQAVEELRVRPRTPPVPSSTATGARILVVEDNVEMNRFVCEALGPDYRVTAAFDGAEGLARALEEPPDLILTDLMMPGTSGDELVRAVRAHPALARTPIIVLSARADDALRVGLLREGVQDYLTKPFAVDELRVRVANLLRVMAARTLEARLAAVVEQAPDGIFLADLEGRYTDVNPAGCQLLGYTRDELVGKTIVELIPPDDVPRLARSRARLDRGEDDVGEWTLRRKDGTWVPVEVSARITPDGRWQGFVRDLTERRRAEAQIRMAHERVDLALRGADLAAWDWNIQTGEVVFNARWCEMRGYRLEEVTPNVDSFMAGIHAEDLLRLRQRLTDYFEGRAPTYEAELRVQTRRGDWIWILDRGSVFARDDQGRPLRMVGTELDITDRKRAEEALRLAEAKASGIVAISADAIISCGADQRITMFNEAAERLFGYTADEVLGAPIGLLIPERHRAAHQEHVQRFREEEPAARRLGARRAEIAGRRKDGLEFPADASISHLAVGGQVILTVAVRDITEQRRREREQRLIAEVGATLASSLDLDQTLINLTRATVGELADVSIVDLLDARDGPSRRVVATRDPAHAALGDALARFPLQRDKPAPVLRAFETRRPVLVSHLTEDVMAAFARGDEHLGALRALALRSLISVPLVSHGTEIGVLSLCSSREGRSYGPADVQLAEHLAGRAALAIESARLYGAARAASAARDEVMRVVAHDLRNPLSSIMLATETLRGTGGRADRRASPVEVIERSARRMDRLIQDLLDATRIETGQLTLRPDRLVTTRVVGEAVESQRPLAGRASIELRLDIPPELPDLWADRDRVLQVFENLLGNALKFTPAGGRITVGAEPRGAKVMFWVADTGSGIPAEQLPRVFDRFWQADQDRRRGAGLGLPITKGIVETHGGRMWVESTPGVGTTFWFTLPQAPREDAWPHVPAVRSP